MRLKNLPLVLALGCLIAAPSLKALPTAVEIHALKIFNGVSPQARSWILEQARSLAGQPHLDAAAIGLAANRRFGGKLTQGQQNELALAVLYQVMKLDEEEYQRKTGQSITTPVASPSTPGRGPAKQGTSLARGNTNPATQQGDKMSDSKIQTLMSNFSQAQTLASSVEKNADDSRNSVIGKI